MLCPKCSVDQPKGQFDFDGGWCWCCRNANKLAQETTGEKKCKVCGQSKTLKYYHVRKSAKDGHNSTCKKCVNVKQRRYNRTMKHRIDQQAYRNTHRKYQDFAFATGPVNP